MNGERDVNLRARYEEEANAAREGSLSDAEPASPPAAIVPTRRLSRSGARLAATRVR